MIQLPVVKTAKICKYPYDTITVDTNHLHSLCVLIIIIVIASQTLATRVGLKKFHTHWNVHMGAKMFPIVHLN